MMFLRLQYEYNPVIIIISSPLTSITEPRPNARHYVYPLTAPLLIYPALLREQRCE